MTNFLLIAIFVSLAGLVVLIIYLIDRVRKIEAHASHSAGAGIVKAGTTDGRFNGFGGQHLWEAMVAGGGNSAEIAEMQRLYAPVLQRHIEELFEEGVLDGRQGVRVLPAPIRLIKTSGGHVASWLPSAESGEIYAIGEARSVCVPSDISALRSRLNAVAQNLFAKANIQPAPQLGAHLLPDSTATTLGAGGEPQSAADHSEPPPLLEAPGREQSEMPRLTASETVVEVIKAN